MAAKVQHNGDMSFATELNGRMRTARVGVMELARASRLSKETIARLLNGQTREPTPATLRKLDAGFAQLEALAARDNPALAVVVSQEDYDLFRQRVAHASSVAGANARAIAEGHEKLDEIRQTLADLGEDVVALREQVAELHRDLVERPALAAEVFDTAP